MSKLSGFVISYNRAHILRATLKAARFVDELIVIDKSSTDDSVLVANEMADRVISVPWSPTVEETRSQALAECSYNWIVALDDDEILSRDCQHVFRAFAEADVADVLNIPIKHYILGRYDPRASYWPDFRPTLSRRGSIRYTNIVHSGIHVEGKQVTASLNGTAFITHLSHENIAAWLEKTNRYTAQSSRSGVAIPENITEFAQETLKRWTEEMSDPYLQTIGILKAIYEIVDGLKRWEEAQPNGTEEFAKIVREIIDG
jgi:glycosyltransferase involved in cell wall biosynthesis